MTNQTSIVPFAAGPLDAGVMCTCCRTAIVERQPVVKCARCGTLYHHSCWTEAGRCRSYHCDDRVNVSVCGQAPDVVISTEEAREAVPLSVGPRFRVMPGAEAAIAARPGKLSILSVAALGLAGVAGCGIAGGVFGLRWVAVAGIVVCLSAMATGIAALVRVNMRRDLKGTGWAASATVLSAICMMVYFLQVGQLLEGDKIDRLLDMRMQDTAPDAEQLARLPSAKAAAVRANVVLSRRAKGLLAMGRMTGSGVMTLVRDGRAYILTNKHVVEAEGTGPLKVAMFNGEKSDGRIEWSAPGDIDVAVVSCQAISMVHTVATEIAASFLALGEPVFAIGNPLELNWSYTEGVISAVRKQTMGDKSEVMVYQTQTPINVGNSGGGLYDMAGRLVGLNTWVKDKAVTEGLNFAISSASILKAMDEETRRKFVFSAGGTNPPPGSAAETPKP